MAKIEVNVEMDDLTKNEDHLAIKFAQPSKKGWWIVCIFPSCLMTALKCFYFCATSFTEYQTFGYRPNH